jgi:hypothetical protein
MDSTVQCDDFCAFTDDERANFIEDFKAAILASTDLEESDSIVIEVNCGCSAGGGRRKSTHFTARIIVVERTTNENSVVVDLEDAIEANNLEIKIGNETVLGKNNNSTGDNPDACSNVDTNHVTHRVANSFAHSVAVDVTDAWSHFVSHGRSNAVTNVAANVDTNSVTKRFTNGVTHANTNVVTNRITLAEPDNFAHGIAHVESDVVADHLISIAITYYFFTDYFSNICSNVLSGLHQSTVDVADDIESHTITNRYA